MEHVLLPRLCSRVAALAGETSSRDHTASTLDVLTELDDVLSAQAAATVQPLTGELETSLLTLVACKPPAALRERIASVLASSVRVSRSVANASQQLLSIAGNRQASPASRRASLTCLAALYHEMTRMMTPLTQDVFPVLQRCAKSSDPGVKAASLRVVAALAEALQDGAVSVMPDATKLVRAAATDRDRDVRVAAFAALPALAAHYDSLRTAPQLEALVALGIKSLDDAKDADSHVVRAVVQALGAVLGGVVERGSASDGTGLGALQGVLALLIPAFVRAASPTTRTAVAGIHRELVAALPLSLVHACAASIVDHLVSLVAKAPSSHAVLCVTDVLSTALLRVFDEPAQRQLLAMLLTHAESLVAADARASAAPLGFVLRSIALVVLHLGDASDDVSTRARDVTLRAAEHVDRNVRVMAAAVLRSLATALPGHLPRLLSECHSQLKLHLEELATAPQPRAHARAADGFAIATSALLALIRDSHLGVQPALPASVARTAIACVAQAPPLPEAAAASQSTWTTPATCGWLLVGALASAVPTVLMKHASAVAQAWAAAFSAYSSVQLKAQPAPVQDAALRLVATALFALARLNTTQPAFWSGDVEQRIIPALGSVLELCAGHGAGSNGAAATSPSSNGNGFISSLTGGSGSSLVGGGGSSNSDAGGDGNGTGGSGTGNGGISDVADQDALLQLQLAFFSAAVVLPLPADASVLAPLLSLAITALSKGKHVATSSLLPALLHTADALSLDGPTLQAGPAAAEHSLQARMPVASVVDEWRVIAHDLPLLQPDLPLAVRVVDAAIDVFGASFPNLSTPQRLQFLRMFVDIVRTPSTAGTSAALPLPLPAAPSSPTQRAAVLTNVLAALLAALRACMASAEPLGSGEVLRLLQQLLQGYLAHADARVRRAVGEALGRLGALVGHRFIASVVRAIAQQFTSKDTNARAGYAVVLGAIHRFVGGIDSAAFLPDSVSVLSVLARDASATVHVPALHSLRLVVESTGLSFSPNVPHTITMAWALLQTEDHAHPAAHVCIVRIINACVSILGPELAVPSPSSHLPRIQMLCRLLLRSPHPVVRSHVLHVYEELMLFAPSAVSPATLLPTLLAQLPDARAAAPPGLYRAALACIRQLLERDAGVAATDALADRLFAVVDTAADDALRREAELVVQRVLDMMVQRDATQAVALLRKMVMARGGEQEVGLRTDAEADAMAAAADDAEDPDEVRRSARQAQPARAFATRHRTKLFALNALHKLLVTTSLPPVHFDLVAARAAPAPADHLCDHLQPMLSLLFRVCNGPEALRAAALHALCAVVARFKDAEDPDDPGHYCLELCEAQISASLRLAFHKDSLPGVVKAGCALASEYLPCRIPPPSAVGRGVALLLQQVRNADSHASLGFADHVMTTTRRALLAVLAKLLVTRAGVVVEAAGDALPILRVAWMQLLRDYYVFGAAARASVDSGSYTARFASSVAGAKAACADAKADTALVAAACGVLISLGDATPAAWDPARADADSDWCYLVSSTAHWLTDPPHASEAHHYLTALAGAFVPRYLRPSVCSPDMLFSLLSVLQRALTHASPAVVAQLARAAAALATAVDAAYFGASSPPALAHALFHLLHQVRRAVPDQDCGSRGLLLRAMAQVLARLPPATMRCYAPGVAAVLLPLLPLQDPHAVAAVAPMLAGTAGVPDVHDGFAADLLHLVAEHAATCVSLLLPLAHHVSLTSPLAPAVSDAIVRAAGDADLAAAMLPVLQHLATQCGGADASADAQARAYLRAAVPSVVALSLQQLGKAQAGVDTACDVAAVPPALAVAVQHVKLLLLLTSRFTSSRDLLLILLEVLVAVCRAKPPHNVPVQNLVVQVFMRAAQTDAALFKAVFSVMPADERAVLEAAVRAGTLTVQAARQASSPLARAPTIQLKSFASP